MALQMGLLGELYKFRTNDWAALPEGLRAGMENYGIDGKRWDVLRTLGVEPGDVALNPATVSYKGKNELERSAGLRLLAQMEGEAHAGIPEGGVAVAASMKGGTRPGTPAGELARMIQFKGFTWNVFQTHFARGWDNLSQATGGAPRGTYAALLVAEATILGAMSYQLNNIRAGKDPERMDTAAFWLKAAAMGGAGGMMGDWLRTMFQADQMNDLSRFAPPLVGLAYNTAAVPFGDIAQMARGEKTGAGREAATWMRKYLPSLFYTRLAQDRLIYDTIQRAWDPHAAQSFIQMQRREMQQHGGQYFSPPGQGFPPPRAPDFTAAAPGLLR